MTLTLTLIPVRPQEVRVTYEDAAPPPVAMVRGRDTAERQRREEDTEREGREVREGRV